jgi:hypothetical protein
MLELGMATWRFFSKRWGLSLDAIDFEPTNFNQMERFRILKKALNSVVSIQSIDLDSEFSPPREKYETIFLLGVLYHLKPILHLGETRSNRKILLSWHARGQKGARWPLPCEVSGRIFAAARGMQQRQH